VAAADPAALPGWDLVDLIAAAHRLAAWAQGMELAAIAELAHRRPEDPMEPWQPGSRSERVSEFAADEISAALHVSRWTADRTLGVALELFDRLPATRAALLAGAIDVPKARAIADAVGGLDDATTATVEVGALQRAPHQTVGQLHRHLGRAVLAANPRSAQKRHTDAAAERRVVLTPVEDGMAEVWALLPAPAAATLWSAVDALAHAAAPQDPRGIDARRADALHDLAALALDDPALPRHAGQRPHIRVHVAATTLLGRDDAPAELERYGPITASAARELAADGDWRRILTDPASGAVLDVGRTTYRPPAALADHVQARDRTCRFPGCRQPAVRCQLDHTTPYPKGPTAAGNLGALCTHHHRLKTETGWELLQHDGYFLWHSPGHRYYTVGPEPALTA